jgi:hypothetical protein
MNSIKKNKWLAIIAVLLVVGGAGYHFYKESQPKFYDDEVKKHYQLFEAKYNYSDCRIWIDYRPQRPKNDFDLRTYEIIHATILEFNKYLIYSDNKDFGGNPGIHLAFGDFCEQSLELGKRIADALVKGHDDITSAKAIAHTADRDSFDTGKPFMPYLDIK